MKTEGRSPDDSFGPSSEFRAGDDWSLCFSALSTIWTVMKPRVTCCPCRVKRPQPSAILRVVADKKISRKRTIFISHTPCYSNARPLCRQSGTLPPHEQYIRVIGVVFCTRNCSLLKWMSTKLCFYHFHLICDVNGLEVPALRAKY